MAAAGGQVADPGLQRLVVALDQLRDRRRVRIWSHDLAVGRRGEDMAHRYLEGRGFTIIARNYELPSGDAEADLIARDGDELVIVEVKTRQSSAYGPPERALSLEKQQALRRMARVYGQKTSVPPEKTRCDLVSIVLSPEIQIEHFRDAVRLFRSR